MFFYMQTRNKQINIKNMSNLEKGFQQYEATLHNDQSSAGSVKWSSATWYQTYRKNKDSDDGCVI